MTAQYTIHTTFSLKGINVLDIKSFVIFFLDYISTFYFWYQIWGADYCDRLSITWLVIYLHFVIHNCNKVVSINFSNLLKGYSWNDIFLFSQSCIITSKKQNHMTLGSNYMLVFLLWFILCIIFEFQIINCLNLILNNLIFNSIYNFWLFISHGTNKQSTISNSQVTPKSKSEKSDKN